MGSKQCGKCGEQVDEAKAFCPGCGNAFVEEEKRTNVSEFDMSNKTVQLGNTMYNQLLSDMGLSISKVPSKSENTVRSVAPAQAAPPATKPAPVAKPSYTKWIILGAVAALGLVFLVILVVLVILFLLWPRLA